MGRMVRIDMSTLVVGVEEVPYAYHGFGGRGLTSAMVATEVPPASEPLGIHNKLVIAPGILSGTNAPNSGRLSIGFKSPLSGGIKESCVGGVAAHQLAGLGLSAIIVEGLPREDEQFILHVTRDGAALIPSLSYRGMKNYELAEALHREYGDKAGILSIGPVGEMKLPLAAVAATDTSGLPCRQAGRGGPGAVMGSKGLKAIIIDNKGGPGVIPGQPEKFKAGVRKFAKAIREHPVTGKALKALGTNLFAAVINAAGAYPTNNFREGTFRNIDKVSGEYMYEVITKRGGRTGHAACSRCIVRCSNVYVDDSGDYITSGLEYGTIWAHGANLDVSDLDSIAWADRLCDDYGIDAVETGQAIGVAMEAGIRKFGDARGARELIEEIGKGRALGRALGGGAWAAGKALGVKRTPAVKGQALGGYDPRAIHGMGVTYATSTMGGDHGAGWAVNSNLASMGGTLNPLKPDGQIEDSRRARIFAAAMDCTGLCHNVCVHIIGTPGGRAGLLEMMSAFRGKEVTFEDLSRLGAAVLRVERNFNLAAGLTGAADRLPAFMKDELLPPLQVGFTVPDEELDCFWREFG
jgi:aldehyde:ferredoxin oxidoreductase